MTTHLANYWSENGHDVSIVCNVSDGQNAYQLSSKVQNIVMNAGGESPNVLYAVYNNLKSIRKLRKEIKRLDPDYLIAMAPTVNITAALACMRLNVTTIGAEQNYPPAEGIGHRWESLRRHFYRLLDAIVAQTETTREWLYKNTNAGYVSVIHGPVVYPLDRSNPILEPDKSDKRKVILSVGRLSAQKQFDHLIEAFSMTRSEHPDWRLVILGEGELRGSLESQVERLDLKDTITLPGVAGNVGDWYEYSDIFALSSGYEGFPNVLIEALTHGLPAVCYDCDTGPRDMINPPYNGLLVPPNDVEALSTNLKRFMVNEDERQTAGHNAKGISERLKIDIICNEWLALMEIADSNRKLA